MKALVSVDVRTVVDDAVEGATENELVKLYNYLDAKCVEIEQELIDMGVWEEDD